MVSNAPPQTLDELASKNLAALLKKVAQQTFDQSLSYSTDFPAFIADPNKATGPFGVAQAIAQQSCRRWARGEGIPSLPGFNGLYGGICKPYLDGIGESPGGESIGRPFTGGQCNKRYEVSITRGISASCADFNRTESTSTGLYWGPILGATRGPKECSPTGADKGVGFIIARSVAGGNDTGFSAPRPLAGNVFDIKINGVAVVNGGASGSLDDDCGSPPPEFTSPRIPPGLPPLLPRPITFPGVGDTDLDVTFNPDGSINVSLPDLGIDVTVPNPLAEDEDEADPGAGAGGDPTDPGAPGGSAGTGDGGEAEGEADEGEELVGLLVQVVSAPGDANVFSNNAQQPFRGIGYVRMGYPDRLGVDISGGTVISPQFFHAQQRGLTNWAVSANVGFNLSVTPYYRDISS